ncbi:MAG: methionyl-tRNA formyltransferase [Deltaproteobacteria bacterium RIFCSPLOWO2_12_FULL_60_19]|nr:MAG: methionyl-tRNA formyltransferase [Deltaproteobacteria bacterium RIFCSPLOWO2_12_FULL_60_19]
MQIVFMGTPEVAAVSLARLLEGSDPVVGVVTQPDRAAGRGQTVMPSPVRKVAERQGIAVLTPEKMRDPAFLSALNQWAPQLIVVVAYGRILPRQILDLPPLGCLNVHYSLLPKYRGAAPVAWAVVNGEEKSGVTTMQLVEKMDAGPVFLQREIPLAPDETAGSLQAKLAPVGAALLMETIAKLKAGSLTPRAQNEQEATYAPMLKKEDGSIDWRLPAVAIERRVRGLSPWPSAYTQLDGKLLKIHRATVITSEPGRTPGEVVRADKFALWIATGEAALSLDEVQLENKKRLPAADFLRGAKIEKGARL